LRGAGKLAIFVRMSFKTHFRPLSLRLCGLLLARPLLRFAR
jgi:hypothetical protein